MIRGVLMIAIVGFSAYAQAARPPVVVPRSAQTVVERLPSGYAGLEPAARLAQPSLGDARRLLATSAMTGDSRLATRADAILAKFPRQTSSAELLRLRAFSAQHRHQFSTAVSLLDQLIALEPRDGDARLSRAQIQMVRGDLNLARADCAALALGVDSASGMLCAAALSLRRGNTSAASAFSEQWVSAIPDTDPRRRFGLVLRAESASRAGDADADAWFDKALRLQPEDVRTLAAYSRHLRASRRPAQALRLLARAPSTDGIHLERTLAAHAAGAPGARQLAQAQARRYALAHKLGSTPEIRDEAEFELTIRGNADAALALAIVNFRSQRDFEDVDLLRRAAIAAGKPEALAVVDAWARSQQLPATATGRAR